MRVRPLLFLMLLLSAIPAFATITVSPATQTVNLDDQAFVTFTASPTPLTWSYSVNAGFLHDFGTCVGGSANCTLQFTPPLDTLPNGQVKLRAGTYTITASTVGETKTATVVVREATLTIRPFNQTVVDFEVRRLIADVQGVSGIFMTWTVNGGGNIFNENRFSNPTTADFRAVTPGTWTVTVRLEHGSIPLTASATIVIPEVTVTVTPVNLTLFKDGTQTYHAQINNTARPSAQWSAVNGTITSSPSGPVDVTLKAGPDIGPGSITAVFTHNAFKKDTATFNVVPVPKVTVTPAAVTVLPGSATRFLASVAGISDTRVTWSTTQPGGTVDAGGLFRAGATLGAFEVRATSVGNPAIAGVSAVTVSGALPPPVSVTVNPSSAIVKPFEKQAFAFYAQGQNNTPHADQTATWTVTPPSGGPAVAVGSDGVFTAPDFGGRYVLTARSNADASKTATATVDVPKLVDINPVSATVAPNAKVFFTGTALGVGNPAVTWSIQETGPGVGSISSSGKYTAGQPGTIHVVATSSANPAVRGTATVRIDPAATGHVVITPASVELDLNGEQRFDALIVGVDDQSVEWSATAGTIQSNGNFTAPNRYGAVEVRATSRNNPLLYGTATVLVTPPGAMQFTYDANGNLIDDGIRQYFWDGENRLARVEQRPPAGEGEEEGRGVRIYTFTYDAFGRLRRLRETVDGAVEGNQTFLWVNTSLAEERNSTGAGVVRRFFAEGMQEGGINYYYFKDHLGNVRDVTDAAGNVRARYDYDAWGRRTVIPGSAEPGGGGGRDGEEPPVARDKPSPLGYNGFYQHGFLGLDLALFRGYSPDLGRWISADPSGLRGGMNVYSFAANDPINQVDRLGLAACPPGFRKKPPKKEDPPECKSIMCLPKPDPEETDDTPEIPPIDPDDPRLPKPWEPIPPDLTPDPCSTKPGCWRGPLTPAEEYFRDQRQKQAEKFIQWLGDPSLVELWNDIFGNYDKGDPGIGGRPPVLPPPPVRRTPRR
ncbi:MAG TPA: RHS repeat-associated core domain-containing protein [Thermoanaerobaculia bacterium]|nr:RHS repeat-associated core domain-containing protein [Thermoanaerobaculia bacterium]